MRSDKNIWETASGKIKIENDGDIIQIPHSTSELMTLQLEVLLDIRKMISTIFNMK